MNSYKLNGTITLSTTFKVAGVLTDPTTITLVVEAPDGTTSTYTYAGAQITRDSIGAYHKDYGPATQLGVYTYTWTGTGTAAGVEEGQFVVVDLAAPISGARSSMTALVLRVRRLINDPSGGSQVYSDAEIQQVLDTNRQDVRYLELTPDWSVSTGTHTTQWFAYYDNTFGGDWETDAVFTDRSWNTLTPDTSDWQVGKWSWNASQLPPVLISGKTYDVYSAAADLLEEWAAKVALDFDVSTGRNNLTASRSQKQAMLLAAADQLRGRGRSSCISVERSDT